MLNSSNQILSVPPSFDELEVSLFGPGVGECIVVHIGNNEWMIIDSCTDPKTKEPIPLSYLRALGVDPATAVKLIVITHWHSDHIRGASSIVEQSKNATVCLSGAFLKEEFLTLVDAFSGLERPVLVDRKTCATKEMASIIKTVKARCESNDTNAAPYVFANADARISRTRDSGVSNEIWTLSPSSEALTRSLEEIAKLIPCPKERPFRKAIPRPDQNHNSVVLFLNFNNECNVLFGSDLEETDNSLMGWSFIVNSKNRPAGKSLFFKIPHHGSSNAHSDEVWKEMIENEAICFLTSKRGGKGSPPRESDIQRIKEFSNNLYSTSTPIPIRQKRSRTVERTMQGATIKRTPLNGEIGQIQIRVTRAETNINLKSPAQKL